MVEPFSAASFAVAIALRLGSFIADVKSAGDEFSDILLPLQNTESTISSIKTILTDPTLPSTLTATYQRELRLRENELLALQSEFDGVKQKLSSSSSFFSRTKQKTLLAYGEMQRLTNKLNFFNQSLQNVLLTHQSMVTSLIYGHTKRTEEKVEKVAVDTSAVRYSVTGLRELVRDDVWDGPAVAEPAGVSGLTQGGGYQNVDSGRRHTMTGATPVPETLRPAGGRGVYSRPVYSPAPIPPRISREVEVSMYPTAGTSAGGVYTAPVYPNASAGPGRGEEEYFNPPPPYSGNRSTSMDSGVPVYPWAGGGAGSLAPPLQGLRHSASGRALQERYADGFRSRQRGQDPWDD